MNKKEYQFSIGEHRFQMRRLPVKVALKAIRLLGAGLIPALAEAAAAPEGEIGDALKHAVGALDSLEDLYDIFVAHGKVLDRERNGFLDLGGPAAFAEEVFCGASDLVLEFLFECVKGEFGNFLSGEGRLAKLIGAKVKTLQTPATEPSSATPSTKSGPSSAS